MLNLLALEIKSTFGGASLVKGVWKMYIDVRHLIIPKKIKRSCSCAPGRQDRLKVPRNTGYGYG